jgi:hypothetical protein
MLKSIRKNPQLAVLVPMLLLLTYTVWKAIQASVVYDEDITFGISLSSYKDIRNYSFATANNHLLITLAIKWLTEHFALSSLLIRLPSLAGHVLFMIYSWLILKGIRHPFARIAAFMLINVNPFMLDFFALARGYSLSVGFMMCSLYYTSSVIYVNRRKWIYTGLSMLAAALSVLASFTMLHFFLINTSILLIVNVLGKRYMHYPPSSLWRSLLSMVIIAAALLSYLIPILFKLQKQGEFYFGGKENFWKDTVGSLAITAAYRNEYTISPIVLNTIQAFVILVMVVGLVLTVRVLLRRELWQRKALFVLIYLVTLLITLSTIAQHYLMGSNFLIERTAMFFIPLFMLLVAGIVHYLYESGLSMYPVLYFLSAVVCIHAAMNINVNEYLIWKDEGKNILKDVQAYRESHGISGSQTLYASWYELPGMQFYIQADHIHWLIIKNIPAPDFREDLYVIGDDQLKDKPTALRLHIIKQYPVIGKSLYAKDR